jgi:shikimate kinase
MQNSGRVIWLQASLETILDRLRQDPATADSRPALTRQGLADEVKTTLAERQAHYDRAADLALNTDSIEPDALVARIVKHLSQE